MHNFKPGDIVEINCPSMEKWHGYRAEVLAEKRVGYIKLMPIGARPDGVDRHIFFIWQTRELVKVSPAVDENKVALDKEELLKLLSEVVQLGIDVAPTLGEYIGSGGLASGKSSADILAWTILHKKGMI